MTIASDGSELDEWPFAPGESPFRVKGLNYRGHLEWTAAHFPGGVEGMHASLPAEMSAFFRGTFLASSFYDLYPLVFAGRAMARSLDEGFLEFVRRRCVWQADHDVHGVYRWMTRLLRAEKIARLMPSRIQQSFEFGDVRAEVIDHGHVRADVDGIPEAIAPWWGAVVETYVLEVLRFAGVESPHVSVRLGAEGPVEDGVKTRAAEIDVFVHRA